MLTMVKKIGRVLLMVTNDEVAGRKVGSGYG